MTIQDRIEYLPRLKTLIITTTNLGDTQSDTDISPYYKKRYTSNRSPDQIVILEDDKHKILKWKNIDISLGESVCSSRTSSVKEIRCRHCHSALLTTMDTDSMLKIKYMPSEHWLELVECWSCHRDEFANIVKNTAEISAVPGCLLVGTDYYLLNKEDVKQCTCMIYEEGAGGIKIDKDDILLDGKSTSFESVLYELLRSLIDAHGSWKFYFRTDEDGMLGIPLWVVAWDIWCAEGEGELRRAMKVTMCNKADDAFETRFESVQKINKIKELINSKRIDEEFFYLIQ